VKPLFIIAVLAAATALPQAAAQGRGPRANPSCGNVCNQSGPHAPNGNAAGDCNGQRQGARRGRGNGAGQGSNCGSAQGLAPGGTNPVIPPGVLRPYVKALQATLEKELYARDYYTAAAQALSGPPRFAKLAQAEQKHANAVANMITYLGGTPVLAHNIPVVVPATVAEADATCEQIELLVIDVYDRLINACPDPAILPMLSNIQSANYAHLDAVNG